MRLAALLLLVGLVGGCHHADRAADTLDADADARRRTAAKTLDDIAAAEQASARPLPRVVAEPGPAPVRALPAEEVPEPTDNTLTADNGIE